MGTIKEEIISFKERTTELIDAIRPQVKLFLKFTIEHYLIITSFLAFLFSIICYIRTTDYFYEWGINFFDYASLTDLYVVALKAGIASIALKSTALIALTIVGSIILLNALLIAATYSDKHVKASKSARISILIAITLLLFTSYLISLSNGKLIISPDNIEQSPRVNVDLRWGGSMQCVSVIAGVSDYLFVWDFSTNKPTALSRTNVTRVEYKTEQQPPYIALLLKAKSGKRIRQKSPKRSPENQKDMDEWETKLFNVCNQKLSNNEDGVATLPSQPIKLIGIE